MTFKSPIQQEPPLVERILERNSTDGNSIFTFKHTYAIFYALMILHEKKLNILIIGSSSYFFKLHRIDNNKAAALF
jgi:hypothetical protein